VEGGRAGEGVRKRRRALYTSPNVEREREREQDKVDSDRDRELLETEGGRERKGERERGRGRERDLQKVAKVSPIKPSAIYTNGFRIEQTIMEVRCNNNKTERKRREFPVTRGYSVFFHSQ
jgi:hypothetical protein